MIVMSNRDIPEIPNSIPLCLERNYLKQNVKFE